MGRSERAILSPAFTAGGYGKYSQAPVTSGAGVPSVGGRPVVVLSAHLAASPLSAA